MFAPSVIDDKIAAGAGFTPIQKQNQADGVVQPNQVQLEFAQDQPEVAFGAPTSANIAPPVMGNNPFLETEDDADLNLTENSARGPTPRAPQEN